MAPLRADESISGMCLVVAFAALRAATATLTNAGLNSQHNLSMWSY
jgi:hypothetical protein